MDKYDALFIRAAKSSNADFRFKRLYKRFYNNEYSEFHLAGILVKVVEKNISVSPTVLVDAFNPDNSWKYGSEPMSYYKKVIRIMTTLIWSTPIANIKDYPRTAYYRNNHPGV